MSQLPSPTSSVEGDRATSTQQPGGADSDAIISVQTSLTAPVSQPAIRANSLNRVSIELAAGFYIRADARATLRTFAKHPAVKQLFLVYFQHVVVTRVQFDIHQSYFFTPDAKVGSYGSAIAGGIFPHNAVTKNSDGTSSLEFQPHFFEYFTTPLGAPPLTVLFTAGKFPPGINTDLRFAEVLNPYGVIYFENHYPSTSTTKIVHVKVHFTIECVGSNYGVVGSTAATAASIDDW